ncbi:hypothetical protein ACSBR2_027194 [Camellia fascicularis]
MGLPGVCFAFGIQIVSSWWIITAIEDLFSYQLKSAFPDPWCLGGDLNEIRNIGERVGCSRTNKGMMDLNSFVENYELSDLPLLGRKFTWCNAQDGERWSRIDRILLNPEWLLKFNFKLWGLLRLFSDHCPLFLMDDERDWGSKPFTFINAWTIHPIAIPVWVAICISDVLLVLMLGTLICHYLFSDSSSILLQSGDSSQIAISKFDFEHSSVIYLSGFGTLRLLRLEIKLFTDS